MRKLLCTICALVIALTLFSCGGKTLIDTYIGKWEIFSRDSVYEDGSSMELILDLKADAVFTETITTYQNGKQSSVVSIDGEYGLTEVDDKTLNTTKGYCLWRRYDLESLQVTSNEGDEKEEIELYKEEFSKSNRALDDAEKEGQVIGLANARVEGLELRWETTERIGFGFNKTAKAKRII